MNRQDPVEQAYREGKFTAERRAHWQRLMGKDPKKTRRTLASLEPCLPPPDGEEAEHMEAIRAEHDGGYPTAPVAAAPTGPTEYLGPPLASAPQPFGIGGNVTVEEQPGPAGPGELL